MRPLWENTTLCQPDSFHVNPLVAGQGAAILQQAGIEVVAPVLENECRHVNRRFYTWHQKKRPYIILKWAQSADGFIDKKRDDNERKINWITTPATQQLVHLWRAQEQAVLVGDTTVVNDNPALTVRLVQGKNPVRIIISPKLDFPLDSKVLLNDAPTFIFYGDNDFAQSKVNELKMINSELKFFAVNSNQFLKSIMEILYHENIQSVLVEGGAFTLNEFIKNNLWDEARVLTGKAMLYDGLLSPQLNSTSAKQFSSDQDEVNIFYNT
jgi:diaminohydroxyphosphoribosylaminopyrimidine deaminase / 5-amino-6-(5-phosphoribosylamino)uracil reductase